MKARHIVVLTCAVVVQSWAAQASEVSVEALSAYVWRGQVLNDETVLQPSLTVNLPRGLQVAVFGNMDQTDNRGTQGEFDEIDVQVSYALPLGEKSPIQAVIGTVLYALTKEGDFVDPATGVLLKEDADTSELFVSLSAACPLQPTLCVNYDYDRADGAYVSLGVSHEVKATEKLSLKAMASVGAADSKLNRYYFGLDDDTMDDANVGLSATLSVNEAVSLGARVAYTWLLDGDLEDAADANPGYFNDGPIVYGGVSATWAF